MRATQRLMKVALSNTDKVIRRQQFKPPAKPYYYLYMGIHYRVFWMDGQEWEMSIGRNYIKLGHKERPTPSNCTIQDGTEFYAWYQHWETRQGQAEEIIMREGG